MQPGSGQRLSHFKFAHPRAGCLQTLDGITDEVGESVDGLTELHKSAGTAFVQPLHPRRDRGRRDMEDTGCLLL